MDANATYRQLGKLEHAAAMWCPKRMRCILAFACIFLTACGTKLEFNISDMSAEQMFERATHVFVGVIKKPDIENWPFLSVPGFPGIDQKTNQRYWRVMRRKVRVELVVKGIEPRKLIDVYEIFWTGATNGNWNSTRDKERDLFMVRVENGRYHVVRDWWRSIFPIHSGSQTRLPLDQTRPLWERFALMLWWVRPDHSRAFEDISSNDPGSALEGWRRVKLLRGLLSHPEGSLRLSACKNLLFGGLAQDECWYGLTEEDQRRLIADAPGWLTPDWISRNHRGFLRRANDQWNSVDRDRLRILTTVNDQPLRREACRLYENRFPDDKDTGCPADGPLPATFVTDDGDVPLKGRWPTQ